MSQTNRPRDLASSRPPSISISWLLWLPLLGACVARPAVVREAWVETIPSGARCVTQAGEIYVTPASIPCKSGVLRLAVDLEGHAPRDVELRTGSSRPRMATFLFGEFYQLLGGRTWEPIEVPDGNVLLRLEPELPTTGLTSTPRPSISTSMRSPDRM